MRPPPPTRSGISLDVLEADEVAILDVVVPWVGVEGVIVLVRKKDKTDVAAERGQLVLKDGLDLPGQAARAADRGQVA